MTDLKQRSPSVSGPVFAPNPMPGRTLIDDDEAARISGLIDEDLKVRCIGSHVVLLA